MGLLDRVMDMVFLPNTGSVVVRSSQGRFFVFCLRVLAPKRSCFVKKYDFRTSFFEK